MPSLQQSDAESGAGAGAVRNESEAMPAEFGLAMAIFVVVASMVGAGILTTSGYTMAFVGSNQYMLGLWVVGAVIAMTGALTLAELSASLPKTGGDYVFLYEAYGPLAAFLSGWASFLVGFSGPGAAAGFGAAKYMLAPLNLPTGRAELYQRVLATAAIVAFALVHVLGRRGTSWAQIGFTVLKVAVLGVLIVGGLAVGWPNRGNLNDPKPLDFDLATQMLFSLVFVYYAYTGWNGASYMAGEIRNPQKVLPRAILWGTGLVALVYLAVNTVYALALSAADVQAIAFDPANPKGVDAVTEIAEIAARRLFGPDWSNPLSVAMGVMMLSTLSVYLLLGPRVTYAMARAGHFPAAAAKLTRRAETPAVATLLQVVVTLLLLWTGTFESIVIYASVGLSMFSMLSMSAIFTLRIKRPDLPRPFRVPWYPVTPLVYLGLTGLLLIAAFFSRPWVSTVSLLSMLAGVPVYYYFAGTGRAEPEARA